MAIGRYKTFSSEVLTASDMNSVQDLVVSNTSGQDAKLITGTAGATSTLAMWNVDGDLVEVTGSTGALTVTTLTINTGAVPDANDGAYLGVSGTAFSDLYLASGALIDFNAGNVTLTHSAGILTVSTGDLRVTTAGTNTASCVTVGGTQTLTAKTLTSPTIGTSPTAAGATWTDLGTVTTADINGGTIDGVTIGAAAAVSGPTHYNSIVTSNVGTVNITNPSNLNMSLHRYDLSVGNTIRASRSRNTTVNSHTIVATLDDVLSISAFGSDGTAFQVCADITMEIRGTPGASDMPGAIVFSTTRDGASTVTAGWAIENDQDLLPETTELFDIGSAAFEVDNIFTQNAVTVSDARKKNVAGPIISATNIVQAIEPKWFSFKDTNAFFKVKDDNGKRKVPVKIAHSRPHTGFVAQEVKTAMTALGMTDWAAYSYDTEADIHSLKLMEFIAVLWQAHRDLLARVAALEAKL